MLQNRLHIGKKWGDRVDIDKRIQDVYTEVETILLDHIRSSYKKGISYLCFGEIKELKLMWREKDFLGSETITRAFEMLVKSEEFSKYVDGFAVGQVGIHNNLMKRGVFWNFKQNYQIFDDSHEFGPQPCPYAMLDEDSKSRLISILHNQSEMGRFVFAAMKYICLYKSLNKRRIFLADEQYFRLFFELPDFMYEAVQSINELLVGQDISSRVISPRATGFIKSLRSNPNWT